VGPHAQTAIVVAAVAGCALVLARRLLATFGRGKSGGACGCEKCPAKKDAPPH
jgi:hypothetical protein